MSPNRSVKPPYSDYAMVASILLVAVGLIGIGAVDARLLLIALPAAAVLLLLIPHREENRSRAGAPAAPPRSAGQGTPGGGTVKGLQLVRQGGEQAASRKALPEHPLYARALQAVASADKDIRNLRKIAARLEDPSVSDSIRELCRIAEAISGNVASDPGTLPTVQRFYDYYLRTAKMLWSQYEVLVKSPFYNKEMEYQVKRIENLLEPLHRNFERYLARSVRGELNRVGLEVGTLERVMRSEG